MMTDTSEISVSHPAFLLATWGGVGLIKSAPGTWGSLAALPFAWVIHEYFGHMALLAASVIIFAVGWWSSAIYLERADTDGDPGEVVIDEVAGQMLLLSMLPLSAKAYAIGFLLFRFFDIVKPWPVSFADKHVKGGLGIMLDDIMAACYPVVILIIAHGFASMLGSEVDVMGLWLLLE